MSIFAPSHRIIASDPFSHAFERETLYQILGCCWGLSSKNTNNQFAIQFLVDLSKIKLIHGSPVELINEDMIQRLLDAFKVRAPANIQANLIEHNMMELLNTMSISDYINFQIGLNDSVEQILKNDPLWSTFCEQSYLTVRYFSISLLRSFPDSQSKKETYAKLIANFLENAREERRKGFDNAAFIWYQAD